jgi:ABC-type antimicrobial peptide transport system permease subunit
MLIGGISAYAYRSYKVDSDNMSSYDYNNKMFEDVKLVEKYFANLESFVTEERFKYAFKEFVKKKDVETVRKELQKDTYSLEELGFESSLYCKVTIQFGEKNKIFCEKIGKKIIVLEEFKDNLWSCTFNNDIELKPKECLNEKEILAISDNVLKTVKKDEK